MKATYTGVRRNLYKRVPLSAGGPGFTTAPDGYEIGDVEIAIDTAALVQRLGPQAMANKSGQSKYLHGCVVVKVIRRERKAA